MSISTQHYPIRDLFKQKQTFVVPKYQRGYAWDDEAISDFIGDITKCLSARRANTNKHHFFGGVVTIRREVADSTRENYEVIDGQQRLASFVMLAGCIVSHIKNTIAELDEKPQLDSDEQQAKEYLQETKNTLCQLYLTFRDNKGIEYFDVPKLMLSKADDDFFQGVISGKIPENTDRESHKRIRYAWECLGAFVLSELIRDGLSASKKAMRIQQFLDEVLGEDCTAIFMCSGERSEAYQIFQVLNDRGVHLGKGDLLRARTLEVMDGRRLEGIQDMVAGHWDGVLAYTPRSIDDYLLWYFSSMEGRRPNPVDLADEFLERRFKCKDKDSVGLAGAKAILSEVKHINGNFVTLEQMSEGNWPDATHGNVSRWDRERLRMLVTHLKHTNAMPLLLSLKLLDAKQFAEAVACIERTVFRYKTIVNAHITPLTRVYLKHAKAIRDTDSYEIKSLRDDLSELIAEKASNSMFQTALCETKFSPGGNNTYIRYFLITIEDYKRWYESGARGVPRCKDKTRVFDVNKTTIEHVYPQKADDEEKKEDLEEVKHNLGNLTILGSEDNTSLANKPFRKKRRALARSNLELNRDIAENKEWTRTDVDKRTEELTAVALKIFVP